MASTGVNFLVPTVSVGTHTAKPGFSVVQAPPYVFDAGHLRTGFEKNYDQYYGNEM